LPISLVLNFPKHCFDKLPAIKSNTVKAKESFQEMAKITGTYAKTNSISDLNKQKVLHVALQKIQAAKVSDLKIDPKAFEVLMKYKEAYENPAQDRPIFGQKQWCALGFKCKNRLLPSPTDNRCAMCNYPTHRFCGIGAHPNTFECSSCLDSKKPPAVIHTNNSTISSHFGGPADPDTSDHTTSNVERNMNDNPTDTNNMEIDGDLKTPTKNTVAAASINSNATNPTSTLTTPMKTPNTSLGNETLNSINAATNSTADLTITPRQTNILNFTDFDNEYVDPENLIRTRCDVRLHIRPTGRFATTLDVIRETREFLQALRNSDPTVMI
jgi:hypothetical protein